MQAVILLLVLLAVALPRREAAFCSGTPDDGERVSDFPLADADLSFVRSADNAELYTAGPANARFNVVHLWGSAYEMGFAQGQLMEKEIKEFIGLTWAWMIDAGVEEMGDNLPSWAQAMILEKGIER
jgi:hypothetical protein